MSAACHPPGSADLYGLGIRLSFYLLWFSVLIGERLHERHAQVPRAVELVFAYAVALGLIMAASRGVITPVDAYAALLLVSTTVYLLVPRAMNVLLMLALLTGGAVVGAMKAGLRRRKKSRRRRRANQAKIRVLRDIETFGGLIVASVLVAAIELTIRWNHVPSDVYHLDTASQLIPLGLVIALIITFLYDLRHGIPGREEASIGSSSNSSDRHSRGHSRGPPSSPGDWSSVAVHPRRSCAGTEPSPFLCGARPGSEPPSSFTSCFRTPEPSPFSSDGFKSSKLQPSSSCFRTAQSRTTSRFPSSQFFQSSSPCFWPTKPRSASCVPRSKRL
ncbi:hypothetical protein VTJ49DRAFT_4101 [Mycothermus thermophilus]|uniref:Uncharacterized protein n=1 Tax=Humicola insolens TaxID=85995 RepID=A0ABR3V6P0_HUMIN